MVQPWNCLLCTTATPWGLRDAQTVLPPLVHQGSPQATMEKWNWEPRFLGWPWGGLTSVALVIVPSCEAEPAPQRQQSWCSSQKQEKSLCAPKHLCILEMHLEQPHFKKMVRALPAVALPGLQLLSFSGSRPLETKPCSFCTCKLSSWTGFLLPTRFPHCS